jgi:hypothetical protein
MPIEDLSIAQGPVVRAFVQRETIEIGSIG